MGRTYLGYRKNISPSQIILFGSYGNILSSHCDANFLSVNTKFSRLAEKLCLYGTKLFRSPRSRLHVSKRDLSTWENFSFHMNAM